METNIVLFVENIYNSVTFDTLIKFIILYFFIIWISVLLWVMKDISNRTNNIFLQIFSVLIILFLTPFWIFIYLLIRPSRTLLDKYYEDLEFQALTWHDKKFCPKCHSLVEDDFKFCWKCWEDLMQKCDSCGKDFSKEYKICPFCGAEKWKNKKDNKKNKKSEK